MRWLAPGWCRLSESGSASPRSLPSATAPPGVVARLARKGAEVIEARGTGERVAVSGVLDAWTARAGPAVPWRLRKGKRVDGRETPRPLSGARYHCSSSPEARSIGRSAATPAGAFFFFLFFFS